MNCQAWVSAGAVAGICSSSRFANVCNCCSDGHSTCTTSHISTASCPSCWDFVLQRLVSGNLSHGEQVWTQEERFSSDQPQACSKSFFFGSSVERFSAVLTAKQERQAGVSSANIWYTSGNSLLGSILVTCTHIQGPNAVWKAAGRGGKDLWKLKANNPELFAKQAGLCRDTPTYWNIVCCTDCTNTESQGAGDAVPPGFEETDKAGWYYNRAETCQRGSGERA